MLRFKAQTIQNQRLLFKINELTLSAGKLVILFGANGTGKSTWLKSIVHPKTGGNEYFIDGKAALELDSKEIAQKISFVDNHFAGLDHLTVEEYISLGRYPYTGFSGRLSAEDNLIILKIVTQLEIVHLLKKPTSELSDGERQRCGIAKALIQDTDVILLDEPTSFLDYPSKIELFSLVQNACRTAGKLVIVSTHDLELGLEYGDIFCVITPKQEFEVYERKLTKTELLNAAF